MPRPNHNIPNLLLGGIKDYAEREGVTVDEAHADLLARGLRDVSILDCIEEHAVGDTAAADGDSGGDAESDSSEAET